MAYFASLAVIVNANKQRRLSLRMKTLEFFQPSSEREARMSRVYIAIGTIYLISVVFEIVYTIVSRNADLSCDAKAILAEFVNFSQDLATLSVTIVNLFANHIFRQGFNNALTISYRPTKIHSF